MWYEPSASGGKKEALVSNLKNWFFFLLFFLCVRILYLNKKVPVAFGEKKKLFLGWGLWNLNVTHKPCLMARQTFIFFEDL